MRHPAWGTFQEGRPARRPAAATGGYSLIEILIVFIVFGVMMTAAFGALMTAMDTQSKGSRIVNLRASAILALRTIVTDLRQTGRVNLATASRGSYPTLYPSGAPTGYFSSLAHSVPLNRAMAGSAAYGPSTEIVYVIARDLNNDGLPINRATGAIEWGPEDWNIALLPQPDGTNILVRRKGTATDRILARNVNRITFADYQTDPTLSFSQIRIRIYMVFNDNYPGHYVETSVATTVNMRNYVDD
jgi:type II secretory pathway pseudopilin PulG